MVHLNWQDRRRRQVWQHTAIVTGQCPSQYRSDRRAERASHASRPRGTRAHFWTTTVMPRCSPARQNISPRRRISRERCISSSSRRSLDGRSPAHSRFCRYSLPYSATLTLERWSSRSYYPPDRNGMTRCAVCAAIARLRVSECSVTWSLSGTATEDQRHEASLERRSDCCRARDCRPSLGPAYGPRSRRSRPEPAGSRGPRSLFTAFQLAAKARRAVSAATASRNVSGIAGDVVGDAAGAPARAGDEG